ncbi:MAG: Lar family restriction alleviation protein [Kiritimatiellae bacterium]|nr:Lar family restriction alleviation protein [Kiritimatiellia bacterium]
MSSGGLKPCPFCGSELQRILKHSVADLFYVECSVCGARGPTCYTEEAGFEWYSGTHDLNAAIDVWNRRAAPAGEPPAPPEGGEG